MMELEIVCKEIIKPLSPTPPELRNLPLSLFDQQAPNMYIQILYFYTNNNNCALRRRRRRLKESLAKALTFYYPFAGRLGDDEGNSIECNDMGASFTEAKLPQPMSEISLECYGILKLSCIDDTNSEKDKNLKPLLSIQLTQFECGGEVMFVFLSHKVADLASLTNFMNDWASIARSSRDEELPVVSLTFNAVEFFPPQLDGGGDPSGGEVDGGGDENICCKRLVFESWKIAAIKAMVLDKVENPTRVQVIAALIYKAAISAKNSVSGRVSATSLLQLINLRNRVVLPLPSTLIGNIISFFLASSTTREQQKKMELWNLVGDMKRNFEEYCKNFPKNYRSKEWTQLHKLHAKESMEMWRNPGDYTLYLCTSWCKFPLYEADFGWGKPILIDVPTLLNKNLILLMDSKDGEGIEAMVSLDKEEMVAFELNIEELLSFCKIKS